MAFLGHLLSITLLCLTVKRFYTSAYPSANICVLRRDPGPCYANFKRWHYDPNTGKCVMFVYGGCRGNANNFESLDECRNLCADRCTLPSDSGPCEAAITRWFYDTSSKRCTTFIYGGCQGNQNNFETRAECRRACADRCSLPRDPGPCRASFPRWYHNTATGTCIRFIYGGCRGNANNFPSKQVCEDSCVADICNLPPKHGPCKATYRRWYYNSKRRRCLRFIYGGCQGNANRFKNARSCRRACHL